MKRLKIPGLADIFTVSDPAEIHALTQTPGIDREFTLRTCPFNWLLLKRSVSVLSVGGRRFPTMTRRDSEQRKERQQQLWDSLNERIPALSAGPEELEPLARWIRGSGPEAQVGMLAQQLLGRLFFPDFVATEESWAAAQVFVAAPRSWKTWFAVGKVRRAKRLLAGMVDGNLSAMNAVGIAVHNVVKGLRHLRGLYADREVRGSLSPQEASRRCLFAPASLYRQATAPGQVGNCPFPRHALFILEVGEASRREGGSSLVFMDDTWSRCPAARWVPAMLEGLWRRATQVVPT